MKQFLMTCLVMGGAAILTACGGGSGGGGGGGAALQRGFSAANITDGRQDMGYVASDYSNVGDGGGLRSSITSGNKITGKNFTVEDGSIKIKTPSGREVTFSVGDGGDAKLYGPNGVEAALSSDLAGTVILLADKNMSDDDYKAVWEIDQLDDLVNQSQIEAEIAGGNYLYPGKYFKDLVISPNFKDDMSDPVKFTGTVERGEKLIAMNAGFVPLQHSTYGIWATSYKLNGHFEHAGGKYPGGSNDTIIEDYTVRPLSGGVDGMKKAPANGASFTGKAMAMATKYNSDQMISPTQKFLTGDATLTIDAGGGKGDLSLQFPNFYNIGFKLDIMGSEFKAQNGSTPTVTLNGVNNTGIVFGDIDPVNHSYSGGGTTYVQGNFYGSGATATETTGVFQVNDKNNTNLIGSFGAMQ